MKKVTFCFFHRRSVCTTCMSNLIVVNKGHCVIIQMKTSFSSMCVTYICTDGGDACLSNPCRQRGTCITFWDNHSYYCECIKNFFGVNCQHGNNADWLFTFDWFTESLFMWLADVTVRRWTYDQQVVGSTRGRVTIKWLLCGRLTVCGQVNHLSL